MAEEDPSKQVRPVLPLDRIHWPPPRIAVILSLSILLLLGIIRQQLSLRRATNTTIVVVVFFINRSKTIRRRSFNVPE